MNKAIHGSFTLNRLYDASPARLFQAFSDQKSKARWFVGPSGWKETFRAFDFRVGGQEIAHGQFPDGPETRFLARYHEIVPDQRIVYVYDMHINGQLLSVSLATIEITAQGSQSDLKITEQGVFFDGQDGNESRRDGTAYLLDKIGAYLQE